MATQLSPGVLTREFDLTNIVPSVSTTEGGVAGSFRWGPVNQLTLIDSENELVQTFWKPNSTIANDWFTAANFLAYGNKLWVVRVVDEDNANTELQAKNATAANSEGFLVKNDEAYEMDYSDGSLSTTYGAGDWIARFAGELGNSLKVSICPSADAYQSTLSGDITITANSTSVSGVSTSFDTEVTVGDLLVIGNETHKVSAIANATSMTIGTRHITGVTGETGVRRWEYYAEVDVAPGTSVFAESLGGSNDEMHVVVVDEDGDWTNQKGSILEVFQNVSKGSNAKSLDGETAYYKDVINQKSKYIRWAGHPGTITNAGSNVKGTTFTTPDLPINASLVGGNDGAAIGNDEKLRGYSYFQNKEEVDVSIILGSDANQTIAVYIINNICENRKDCVAFFSPPKAYVVNNVGDEATSAVTFRNTLPSTSYAALDSAWKYQYDRYNDVYRYVPMNGDTAGLHVRTDTDRDPWWAAGGLNRGQIKNVIKLPFNPRQADRDILYKNGINPVVTFPGEGTVLWGNKTLLSKPSAFDRINVRRLFIVLEKAISKASKYLLFEFNDEFTRAQFRNMVEPYLRDVQGRRGIYDFAVICNETNNTPEVIDRNEFVGSIFIKPARTAEFITLNFVAVPTGVEFTTVTGQQF